jgi:uncharacterized membrane protein
VAIAGMVFSLVMLRSRLFGRATAYVGMVASGLDLAYCVAFAALPMVDSEILALLFIPAAGLALMAWHILVGWKLLRLERHKAPEPA